MRCYCCNNLLTPQQATRKFKLSGVYVDMCDVCLNTIDVETEEGVGVPEDEELFDDEGNPNDYSE